jgi:hypothetical protein
VKGRSSAVLLALAVTVLVPSLGLAQYAPKWHVGDWWVTKRLGESPSGWPGWEWTYTRYDVVRVAKVGRRDCFVLQTATSGPNGELGRDTRLYYVRVDDWLVVRMDIARFDDGKPCPPGIRVAPLGLYGPGFSGEPALPRFPLRLDDPDTTFKLKQRDDCSAELRELSSRADTELVKRLIAGGDSAGGRVVRPTGPVYQVRNEGGGDLGTDNSLIVQSLQFWSDDLPWRAYEELVHYTGPKPVRRVVARTWLTAVGHGKK